MKINLSKIGEGILDCIRKFPAEASLGIYFLAMYIIQANLDYQDTWRKEINDLLPLLPAFYVLTYSLNLVCKGKTRILYWLSPYIFLPFLFVVNLEHFTLTIAHAFTLVLSLFVLLACKRRWDNREFADSSVQTCVDMIIAFFIGHVLALATVAIYASVVYIFDFEWGHLMEYLYVSILFVFIPLMFCHLQDKKTEYTVPRFIEIIINYILSPAVVIYTGILYLYIIVIVVHWELPKGGIGYMVLAFIAVAMAGRMAQLIVAKPLFQWFYDRLNWIALPPLALFWVGCIERINTYSLTESRVYLLVSGILTTMYILFLFSKLLGTYQLMALISIIFIGVLTFVPGISAKNIGIQAQTHRLKKYIRKLDMLNDSTQKLKTGIVISMEEDSIKAKEYKELKECYYYLKEERGKEQMLTDYGPCNIVVNERQTNRQLSLQFNSAIDITIYTKYIGIEYQNNEYVDKLDEGILTIRRKEDQHLMVRYDIDEYMNTHFDQMTQYDDYANIPAEPLIYRNDSCLVFLDNLSYASKNGKFHCTHARPKYLFIK